MYHSYHVIRNIRRSMTNQIRFTFRFAEEYMDGEDGWKLSDELHASVLSSPVSDSSDGECIHVMVNMVEQCVVYWWFKYLI